MTESERLTKALRLLKTARDSLCAKCCRASEGKTPAHPAHWYDCKKMTEFLNECNVSDIPKVNWREGFWGVKCPCHVCMFRMRTPTCIHAISFLETGE